MSKKWYNYFVSVGDSADSGQPEPDQEETAAKPVNAAQSVAEIAQGVAPVTTFTAPVSDPTSFDDIYKAAEIPPAPQGYSILKVAEMLQSEHIRNLAPEVKRSSVLVALDAAGVDIKDVIQDSVRRDRALDGFEAVQQRALNDLEGRKTKENQQIQAEMERLVAEQQAKIKKNNEELSQAKDHFFGWRLKKQQEEKKISDAVGYFTTENPITTGNAASAPAVAPKNVKGA
jgi:hypothetical protein